MKNIDNRAFTVVELIITFSIVMTISLGLFKVVDAYREKQQQESFKKDINSYINEVVKVVKDDILKNGIKKIEGTTCTDYNQGIKITFSNNNYKNLCVGKSSDNGIKYGDIFYKVPSKFVIFKDDIIFEQTEDSIEKPIYNMITKVSNDDASNEIIVPVIKKETHYTIDIKLNHTELKENFDIIISATSRTIKNTTENLSTDTSSTYIEKIEYTIGMDSLDLEDKYIDKFEINFDSGYDGVANITNKIKLTNCIVNTMNMSLKANSVLITYLNNNKINEVNIPKKTFKCSADTCSITWQIDGSSGEVGNKYGYPNYNLNNLNKISVKQFDDDMDTLFYSIKLGYSGYLKALDLRNNGEKYKNNIFFPFYGIQIGNLYLSDLSYIAVNVNESSPLRAPYIEIYDVRVEETENNVMDAILRGYRPYNYTDSVSPKILNDITGANGYKYQTTKIAKVNKLIIDPIEDGELKGLPPALSQKVDTLILSTKVTSIDSSIDFSGYGLKTIKFLNNQTCSNSQEFIKNKGFSCNCVLNKCYKE